jgi:ComEC/Rec2-related protein
MGANSGKDCGVVSWKWILVGVFLIIAGVRYSMEKANEPEIQVGDEVRIQTRLDQAPRAEWGKQVVDLQIGRVRVQAKLGQEPRLEYGDRVEIVGKLTFGVTSKTGENFGLIPSDFRVLHKDKGWLYRLNIIRSGMQERLVKWVSGDEGGLAAGILLGGGEMVSREGYEAFKKAGLLHVVAASGYNVTVVSGWLMSFGWRIWGRRRSIYFGILCVVLYVFLAGAGVAVIRAGIMSVMSLVALRMGRPADAGWLLVLAATGMLVINPLWLEDIGFQLSVAATGGLVWLDGIWGKRWPGELKTSLSAQMATWPLIAHHFGNLNVAAPIINLVTLWIVPLVMPVLAIALAVGGIWQGFGQVVAFLAWPPLAWMTGIAKETAKISWINLEVARMGWGWVAGYYVVLMGGGYLLKKKLRG